MSTLRAWNLRLQRRRSRALQVKTLPTIMKELGHDHIDVLKLDVEGSE